MLSWTSGPFPVERVRLLINLIECSKECRETFYATTPLPHGFLRKFLICFRLQVAVLHDVVCNVLNIPVMIPYVICWCFLACSLLSTSSLSSSDVRQIRSIAPINGNLKIIASTSALIPHVNNPSETVSEDTHRDWEVFGFVWPTNTKNFRSYRW